MAGQYRGKTKEQKAKEAANPFAFIPTLKEMQYYEDIVAGLLQRQHGIDLASVPNGRFLCILFCEEQLSKASAMRLLVRVHRRTHAGVPFPSM